MGQKNEDFINYKQISLKEKVTQSPFDLYKKYGKFPWQFFIFVLLLIFSTYQVFILIEFRNKYIKEQSIIFQNLFISSFDTEELYEQDSIIYDLNQFQKQIKNLFQKIIDIDDELILVTDNQDAKYFFDIQYQDPIENAQYIYDITLDDMHNGITQPFDVNDISSIKEFIQEVDFFTFTIQNLKTSGLEDTGFISCLLWEVKILYDFLSYTGVQVSLQVEPGFCKDQKQLESVDSYIFIHTIVIILAIISFYMGINSVYKMWKNFKMYEEIYINKQKQQRKMKFNKQFTRFQTLQKQGTLSQNIQFEQFIQGQELSDSDSDEAGKDDFQIESDAEQIERIFKYEKPFKQLSFKDKLIFFNMWIITGLIAALIQIVGSCYLIVDLLTPYQFEAVEQNIIGIGAGLIWILMLYYLSFNPNILGFINALEISGSKIFWFTLGVMPFFIAFLFLFESIFWQFRWFDGTHNTSIALFALMNGDSVNVIFSGTSSYGFMGTFFLIIYIILFFTSVQNVFIIIIMEGYDKMVAKQKEKIQQIKKSQQQKNILVNQELNTQDMQLIQNLTQQGQILEKSDGTKEFINQKIILNQKLLDDQLKFIEEQFNMFINDDSFTFDIDAKSSLKLLAAEQHHEILNSIKEQVKKKIERFKQLTIKLNDTPQKNSNKQNQEDTQNSTQ